MRSAAWVVVLGAGLGTPLAGQFVAPGIGPTASTAIWVRPGQVVSHVTSAANPAQQYAVYLPSNYRTDRIWPVLVLLDPRGRALLPLERVRGIAERLGYLVLSSWNSRSDELTDHNADAINAILDDADRLLSIDPHRIYLAGQSGTARGSWIFGYQLLDNVAGLIGFGAGLPEEWHPPIGARGPVFFGAAGLDDYNFDEMWRLDATLDTMNVPHHLTWFDGPHAWPQADVLTEAVQWVTLQAMLRKLAPVNRPWVDSLYRDRLADAAALKAAGASYRAWRRYAQTAADFNGLRDISAAMAGRRSLDRAEPVVRMQRNLERLTRKEQAFRGQLGDVLSEVRVKPPMEPDELWRRLGLGDLVRRSEAMAADSMAAHAAKRQLANVWAYTGFYEPRHYLLVQEPERALSVLGVAERLHPGDPSVALYRAEALARVGRRDEALASLGIAARGGAPVTLLDMDPTYATLRADSVARAILTRLVPSGGQGR